MRFLLALLLLSPTAGAGGSALRHPDSRFWRKHAPAEYRVRIDSSRGAFVLEVHRDWAPVGADRFYNLVRAGYYDDSRFFRVTPRFAQFGIAGDPAIAALWRETIPDDAVRQSNVRGRFAFAMTGPNARTTQIYICKVDMISQDQDGFAPLGSVIEGMDVVDRLYAEYGERAGGGMRGGKQGRVFTEGNAHLDRDFPKLERLLRARIVH
jgi:cyclophilin family peptidyl-prolyl cis-trans isomerase